MREARSFCRTCIAQCGMVLTIDDEERLAAIRPDRAHPLSAGHACFKGLQAPDMHNDPARLRQALKRRPDGSHAPIPAEQAFDEIAARLMEIRGRGDPDAIGLFRGTGLFHNSSGLAIQAGFLEALGTASLFTTLSIDQSAKGIAACRMGFWHAGRDHVDTADTLLLIGSNPLISHSAGGFLTGDPVKRIRRAVADGLKLVVIDPRLTETARFATIHLQPLPGEDAAIAAGMLRLILTNGWHDSAFVERHVAGLAALRRAVEPFTPDAVAARAGIRADDLVAATRLYATGRKGGVVTGTGTDMGPRSNLAEHLAQCIEIVCGRYKRAGEPMPNADPLIPAQEFFAEVVPPSRPWTQYPPSRIRGVGNLFGEKLTGTLAEEILTPGRGQVRALIVDGANIANSVPGKADMLAALRSLELLVVIDPVMTATARLADYVIAPKLPYERADLPITLGIPLHTRSWAQYTPAIVPPPPGSDVVDDWYVFWSIAKRMGLTLRHAGVALDMAQPPATDTLLDLQMRDAVLSLDALKARPDAIAMDPAGDIRVQPARPGSDARFELDADGVLDELAEVARDPVPPGLRLIVRRMRDVNGSIAMAAPAVRRRNPVNPLGMNPQDMAARGLAPGGRVEVTSADGRIRAIAEPDDTLRPGVVSMSHNWGGVEPDSDDYASVGSSSNALIRCTGPNEALNAMPRMTAVPVDVRALAAQPLAAE